MASSTALKAPHTGRESDCIFNNKPVSRNMFFVVAQFSLFSAATEVMIKTLIILQKISISDRCCSSKLSIHQRNLKKRYSTVLNNVF